MKIHKKLLIFWKMKTLRLNKNGGLEIAVDYRVPIQCCETMVIKNYYRVDSFYDCH